jgi:RHS repeat-associated protein
VAGKRSKAYTVCKFLSSLMTSNDIGGIGFTGHRHNNVGAGAEDVGLIYMNARFYVPGIGRFASADTLVPDPMNPQQFNRYSYVLNNPLRYSDPTGRMCYDHTAGPELLGTCINEDGSTYSLVPSIAALSSPCTNCSWSDQFGDMGRAYQVFMQLEQLLGRSVTTAEVLALVAHHEFGWALRHNQEEYDTALEAMGRQFYNFCGADGICQGDQLWKFLGAQQAWYAGNAKGFAQELTSGSLPAINYAGAARVLGQPAYDPATATAGQMRSNWRSGNGLGDVPFKYGNYSMFSDSVIDQLSVVNPGINGSAVTTVYLNRPDLNYGNGYVVMTMGQFKYWTAR